ncbi:MAG: HAD-IA family hydrolase, partial [Deltaproteobacteria bacterium]|nr:HAD-IA family hydrolase [Deltaproteobacteria bacterium]
MAAANPLITLSPRDYDAFLFDLDGVLTRTANIHAAAWKKMFDGFLERRAAEAGEPFVPFDIESDYRLYVDGRPRHSGVATFLASRGIELPEGSPGDAPGVLTVHGLGGLKDGHFMEELERKGPERFEESVELVRTLRALEIRTAVVSSSKNAAEVLKAAGIAELFDARVDGNDILRLGMRGKPSPDAFLEGARRLGADPSRTVVVEDAIAGVEAGRAGAFGLVIGVDRFGRSQELRDAGADVVVTSLSQVQAAVEPPSAWSLVYEDFDPGSEGVRESLCTLGNGYFATRGAAPWATADDVHYPGTYVAGGYNRLRTDISGKMVENEDLVNFPNWLALDFRIAEQAWFDMRSVTLLSYRQELDLSRGLLLRTVRFEDGKGRRSRLAERRLVSMSDKHLAALELSLTAENWSGVVTVRSAVDGRVENAGARLYREFNNRHLVPLKSETVGGEGVFLEVRTCQSNLHVGQAARTRGYIEGKFVDVRRRVIEEPGYMAQEMKIAVAEGQTLVLEKVASLHTSRDQAVSECGLAARKAIIRAGGFEELLAEHALAWKHLWRRFDVHLRPAGAGFKLNVPMLLRLNMFHLLQAVSHNSIGLDIGVPARGWTGEAY